METQNPKHEIIELNSYGDQRTMWCPENETETETARKRFNTLRDQNCLAFKTTGRDATEQIREFDPTAETIVMVRQMVGG